MGNLIEQTHHFTKDNMSFGIDLGTTYSVITCKKDSSLDIVVEVEGRKTTPSCVEWLGGDNFVVGQQARLNKVNSNVASSFKKYMGTDTKIKLVYNGEEREFTPEFLSSKVLEKLVTEANKIYPNIDKAVITVPAQFNDNAVNATRVAAGMVGIDCMTTVREPSAASLLYDSDDVLTTRCLVYDLGGGTFDVSIADITKMPDPKQIYEFYGFEKDYDEEDLGRSSRIVTTSGDTALGGDDLDDLLSNKIIHNMIYNADGTETDFKTNNPNADYDYIRRVFSEYALRAKRGEDFSYIEVPLLPNKEMGIIVGCKTKLSKNDFVKCVTEIYERTKVYVKEALNNLKDNIPVDTIITVGGSTKSALLKELIQADFPNIYINDSINADIAVGVGAGVVAYERVTGGNDIRLTEVLPISLGIESDGGIYTIIKKDTLLPTKVIEDFVTTKDDQKIININVYQGDTGLISRSTKLGTIKIEDLPKANAGDITVYVEFSVNFEGVLSCNVTCEGKEISKKFERAIEIVKPKQESEYKMTVREETTYLKWVKRAVKQGDAYLLELCNIYKSTVSKEDKQNIINYISSK